MLFDDTLKYLATHDQGVSSQISPYFPTWKLSSLTLRHMAKWSICIFRQPKMHKLLKFRTNWTIRDLLISQFCDTFKKPTEKFKVYRLTSTICENVYIFSSTCQGLRDVTLSKTYKGFWKCHKKLVKNSYLSWFSFSTCVATSFSRWHEIAILALLKRTDAWRHAHCCFGEQTLFTRASDVI